MSKRISKVEGLNVVSLFDGVSMARIALEKANVKINNYFFSEIKKHAIENTLKKFPSSISLGDVCKVHYENNTLYKNCGREIVDCFDNYKGRTSWTKEEVDDFKKKGYEVMSNGDVINWTLGEKVFEGKIDLLIGGSPCTQFSFASCFYNSKEKYGLKGKDSKLFYEYDRIRREVNPTYYFLENVRMKKESKKALDAFMEVEGISANSELVSFAYRDRIYWTNIEGACVPKDRNVDFRDYKIMTIPRMEAALYKRRFEGDTTKFNLTSSEIEEICVIPSNKWAREELDKAFGRKLTNREFVDEIHTMLYESMAKKTPYRVEMWNGGLCNGRKVNSKNITNAKKTSCITRKVDRCPSSCGLVSFHDFFRFATSLELCKGMTIEYKYLYGMSYKEVQDVCGDGFTLSMVSHFLEGLNNVYDFGEEKEA